MIEWLFDTLVATGALMTLVLAVRRPVARWFGPGAAYALWSLPMIRLVLPPLALPRGLIPHLTLGVEQTTAAASALHKVAPVEAATTTLSALPVADVAVLPAAQIAAAAPVEPSLLAQVPWGMVALAVWLGGAVAFLIWRTVTYRWMRRDLLAGARLVARSGGVRILETPTITAPLAFGVFDKVVALPRGFLAEADSETSDFAIAHEMEHHAGNDLLALIAMQPLFALHWFNPIGWAGWRAVRGDQEAFCDARVMAGRSRAVRARYGRLIASMASGTRLGLAAPMAGPLSGEKPIIQRLRALAAQDVTPARRLLARSLFALAIVAVPATATVSYAAMDEAEPAHDALANRTVAATPRQPAVPAAPAVPATRDIAPDFADEANIPKAPEAPEVPEAPEPPEAPEWSVAAPVPPVPPVPPAPMRLSAQHAAISEAQAARISADAQRMAARAVARATRVVESVSADGKRRTIRIVQKDGGVSMTQTMVLDSDCPADRSRPANGASGTRVICTGEPAAAKYTAINALRTARESIAANAALGTDIRAEILADLDREIADARREAEGS
jgi:beta-lactamase regulating signal transducer with metallopeptidase domain